MNYYSGGLAELVNEPSRLTWSFLQHWFCGKRSFGRAMQILGLPYEQIQQSVLVLNNEGQLRVDLETEEKTLYKKTIFSYKKRKDESLEPYLQVNWGKLFVPSNWRGTYLILKKQIDWLTGGDKLISEIESWVLEFEKVKVDLDWREYDQILAADIWPRVMACGIVCEYYFQVLKKTFSQTDSVWAKIDKQMSVDIQESGINMSWYFELAEDKWDKIKVTNQKPKAEVFSNDLANKYLRLHRCRIKMRKICLEYFYELRMAIFREVGNKNISALTRNMLLGESEEATSSEIVEKKLVQTNVTTKGQGRPVSGGVALGKLVKVNKSNVEQIDFAEAIGVFPNASTEFTVCYPKCRGIIFLAGGQTSHGAIVAREFGIPAIIESGAIEAKEGVKVEVNGNTGNWVVR